jgi:hypothetical protein
MTTVSLDSNFDYFVKSSFAEYREGEWLAIYDNKVIAHEPTLKAVISKAKRIAPMTKVLISKVKKTACYL